MGIFAAEPHPTKHDAINKGRPLQTHSLSHAIGNKQSVQGEAAVQPAAPAPAAAQDAGTAPRGRDHGLQVGDWDTVGLGMFPGIVDSLRISAVTQEARKVVGWLTG